MRFKPTLVFILMTAVLALSARAEELRPVTHEDIWTTARVGTPVIAPDGRTAVVSVTVPSYEEDGDRSDLWLLTVDGSRAPRQLTATSAGESDVAWRPDGGAIAFSAKRGDDEEKQVYLLDMNGPGEAIRITSLSTGASKPAWSPDGSRIAFESRVYPGALDDEANAAEKTAREERKYNVSAYETFPIRYWDHWLDDRQTHLFVQPAEAGAEARNLLAGTELVAGPGFSGTATLSGNTLNATWAPDGETLVFNATTNRDQAAHARVRFQLYSVAADGGEPVAIAGGPDWSCTGPQFDDKGEHLYCGYSPENDWVYNLDEIAQFRWRAGEPLGKPRLLTDGFDRSVSGFDLDARGRRIYFTAADAGRSRIYELSTRNGDVRLLDPDGRGVYAGVQAAGGNLMARWESGSVPAEIVRVGTKGGHDTISAFNAGHFDGVDLQPFVEFWF